MTVDGSQSGAGQGFHLLFPSRNGHKLQPIGSIVTETPPNPGRRTQWQAGSRRCRGRGAGAQVQQRASRTGGRGATSAVRGPGVGGARAPSSQREGCGKSRPENGRRRRCRAERRRRRRRGGETVSGTAAAAGGDPCRGAEGRGGTWRGRGPRGRATRLADGVPPLYPPPPAAAGDGSPLGPSPALAVTVLGAVSLGPLRLTPPSLPPPARIPATGPAGAPVAGVLPVGAARASCPSRGFGPAASSRARRPGLSLDRALPSPSLARPLCRYSAPPLARVRSPPPVGRVRHKGSCALTPISRLCLPLLLAHSMTFCPHCERVGPPSPFPSSRNK